MAITTRKGSRKRPGQFKKTRKGSYTPNANPDLLPESVKQVLKILHPSLYKEATNG